MIDLAMVMATIEQYETHGWVLRRASLPMRSVREEVGAKYPDINFSEGSEEFLWLSRRSLPDREAWELRRLSGSPFALVAFIDDSFSEEQREKVLNETQRRMFDGSHPEPTSH